MDYSQLGLQSLHYTKPRQPSRAEELVSQISTSINIAIVEKKPNTVAALVLALHLPTGIQHVKSIGVATDGALAVEVYSGDGTASFIIAVEQFIMSIHWQINAPEPVEKFMGFTAKP